MSICLLNEGKRLKIWSGWSDGEVGNGGGVSDYVLIKSSKEKPGKYRKNQRHTYK